MSLKDITITGSIGSIATQSYGQRTYISSTDEQSFPIETITGSQAGVWPDFTPDVNYTVGLVVNVTQSWSSSNVTPLGIIPYVHNTMEEFIDGEFSGSNYTVSNGNLNDAQCEQYLYVSNTPISTVEFTNSDCDVLINNVSINDYSISYRKVTYDNGVTIPTNLQQIISGTAEFAEINDYLFSSNASTLPRYQGSRTTSPGFNLPSVSGFNDEELSNLNSSNLSVSTSGLPNVSLTKTYFAYFEQVTNNFPRNTYGSKVYITKLVGPGGETIALDNNNKHLFDIDVLFNNGSTTQLYYTNFTYTTSSITSPSDSKIFDTTIDESGICYKSIFYFRPNLLNNTPLSSSDGRFDLDLLDTRAFAPLSLGESPYIQHGTTFNAKYNLYSLNPGDLGNIYFKYNLASTASAAATPYTGSGYFMGLALCLANVYFSGSSFSIPDAVDRYADYYGIRFNSPSSISNYEVTTDLLPIKTGDYVRVFNAQGKNDQGTSVYLDDADVLFFRNLVDQDNIPFPIQRGYVSYDRKIIQLGYTLPSIYIPFYNI